MLTLAATRFPGTNTPERVEYVWSGNTAALVGAVVCFVLLLIWLAAREKEDE